MFRKVYLNACRQLHIFEGSQFVVKNLIIKMVSGLVKKKRILKSETSGAGVYT